MLYVKRCLASVSLPNATPFEIVGADVHGSHTTIRFVVCYRPSRHPSNVDLSLYETLSGLIREKASVLAGNVNCPGVDWNQDLAVGEGFGLVDFKQENFLYQMVREPTRGDNVLDLIFSAEEDLISEVEVGEARAGSDHNAVQCMVGLPSDQEVNRTRERWNLRRADYDNFRRDLFELPHPVVGPAEDMWAAFHIQFQEIQERPIPRKNIGGEDCTNPRWFNGGISRGIKKCKRLYQEAKKHPTPVADRQLTIQRRFV